MHAYIVSCENKASVVAEDEFESSKGIRATLNLGHTFGHALKMRWAMEIGCMVRLLLVAW